MAVDYSGAAVPDYSAAASTGSTLDLSGLKNLWVKAGGDPAKADLMARVAYAESAGNPNARSPTGEGVGYWQINPKAHGPGDWTDPLTNAKKAVALYNARVAHGGSGLEDWEASRNEGAGGGWGQCAQMLFDQRQHQAPARRQKTREVASTPDYSAAAPDYGAAAAPTPTPGLTPTPAPSVPSVRPSAAPSPAPSPTTAAQTAEDAAKRYAGAGDSHERVSIPTMYEDVTDLQYVIGGAYMRGLQRGDPIAEMKKAVALYKKNPHEANQQYSVISKGGLTAIRDNETNPAIKAAAGFLVDHPWALGIEAGAGELFNIPQNLIGSALFNIGGKILKAGARTPPGAAAANWLNGLVSPFAHIVQDAGDAGKHAVASVVNRIRGVSGTAQEDALKVFAGKPGVGNFAGNALTVPQKIDVMRRSEGILQRGTPNYKLAQATPDDPITRAAVDYRKAMIQTTEAQKAHPGLLETEFDPHSYHFMAGAYEDDALNHLSPSQRSFVEELHPTPGAKTRDVRLPSGEKTYKTIDEAIASGKLRDDFDPATQFARYLTTRRSNVEFEQGMKSLPDKLVRPITGENFVNSEGQNLSKMQLFKKPGESDVQALQRQVAEKNATAPEWARYELKAPDNMIPAKDVFPGLASPTLQESFISPGMAGWLTSQGRRSFTGQRLPIGKDAGVLEKTANALGQGMDNFNSIFRNALVTNVMVHPFWNLATNSSALKRDGIGGIMLNYTRAMANAIRATPEFVKMFANHIGEEPEEVVNWAQKTLGKKLEGGPADPLAQKLLNGAQLYAEAVHEAFGAGAGSGINIGSRSAFGGDTAHILTTPFSELGLKERVDKLVTQMNAINLRGTFGKAGEVDQESRLFSALAKRFPNATPQEMAWMTREGLGNYANISSTGPDALASQFLFFYPFLKTNAPFWSRIFMTAPKYYTAPHEGFRRVDEAGEPKGTPPHKAFGANVGDWSYSSLHPARAVEDIFEAISPSRGSPTDDLTSRIKAGVHLVEGRLQPLPGLAEATFETAYGRPNDPEADSGFRTVYQQGAPKEVQWKQAATYALTHLAPIPGGGGFLAQDVSRRGVDPDALEGGLFSMLGFGSLYHRAPENQRRILQRAGNIFTNGIQQIDRAARIGPNKTGISAENVDKRQRQLYDHLRKTIENVKKQVPQATAAPTPDYGSAVPDYSSAR